MALKTVWCEVCKKPWRPKSRKEPCPNCRTGLESVAAACAESDDGESDAPLANTLAPANDESARELVDRYGHGQRVVIDAPSDEIECPRCAERIKAKAKVCRFCNADLAEPFAKRERRAPERVVVRERWREPQAKPGGGMFIAAMILGAIGVFVWPAAVVGLICGIVSLVREGPKAIMPLILCVIGLAWAFSNMSFHFTATASPF